MPGSLRASTSEDTWLGSGDRVLHDGRPRPPLLPPRARSLPARTRRRHPSPPGSWGSSSDPRPSPKQTARCSPSGSPATSWARSCTWPLALIYFGMGVPWAGAANLLSTGAFLIGLLLLRSGRTKAGNAVGWLEVIVHLSVFTVLTGLQTGYVAYIAILLVVPFSVFRSAIPYERWVRRAIVVTGLALSVAIPLLLGGRQPLWPLEPWQARVVLALNLTNVIVALVAIAYYTMWVTDQAEANLAAERDRSETLLLNILPPSIAEQLKAQPGTIARQYESVTVLFADICGFTLLSARISSQELIEMLNEVFSEFDRLAERHGLEKIKTIGDAYMAACGLPEPREGTRRCGRGHGSRHDRGDSRLRGPARGRASTFESGSTPAPSWPA